MNLGAVEESQGHIPEAVAEYRSELRLHPSNADAHVNLANALAASRQFNEAVAEYRKAIELKPQDSEIHMAFASLAAPIGRRGGGHRRISESPQADSR